MRIFYHLSDYISHKKAGQDYIACLESLGHTVLTQPEDATRADVAIIHDEPVKYPDILKSTPALKELPLAVYAVWETNKLPRVYAENLTVADEIWTCSDFSRKSMTAVFGNVSVLPHAVARRRAEPSLIKSMRERIGADNAFIFFSITDSVNPRKNISGLLTAFAILRKTLPNPDKARLVLKQYRIAVDFDALPGVMTIDEALSDEEITALHIASNAYVSAHHSEAWGLGLSEAMALGKPAIATGYSGNMEFMTGENSFPVEYDLAQVSADMCKFSPLFTEEMFWANIRPQSMAFCMRKVFDGRYPHDISRNAAAIVKQFGPPAIAKTMQELLDSLVRRKQ